MFYERYPENPYATYVQRRRNNQESLSNTGIKRVAKRRPMPCQQEAWTNRTQTLVLSISEMDGADEQ